MSAELEKSLMWKIHAVGVSIVTSREKIFPLLLFPLINSFWSWYIIL